MLIITGKTNVSCRQLPGGVPEMVSGDRCYHFFINDESVEPDIVVVRNKYIKRKRMFHVAPECTLLMMSEPESIVRFTKNYCRQFAMVYSCQENIEHDNVMCGPALLPWFVGVENRDGKSQYSIGYDEMARQNPVKTKLMSVITSDKAFTRGHQERIEFVAKLKARYGDNIDVYGRGFRDFGDKWDVMAPYKYHVAIENSSSRYYWTEKLSDCYLAGCFPIYYGCKNIGDYFPQEAMRTIDIHDFEVVCEVIDRAIENDAYGKSEEALKRSKRLVMDDYNMFATIAKCCDKMDVEREKREVEIGVPWDMKVCNFIRYALVFPCKRLTFALRLKKEINNAL